MADEKIVRSVRAPENVFKRIQEISKEKGLDQGATMEALLTAWDVQAAKGLVPERAADVADFDASVQALQKAFLRSLDLAQNAEQRARIGFQAQLDALSGTVARLEAGLKNANLTIDALTEENERLKRDNERMKRDSGLEALLTALSARLDEETDETEKPERTPAKPGKGRKRGAKPEPEETTTESGNSIPFPETGTNG